MPYLLGLLAPSDATAAEAPVQPTAAPAAPAAVIGHPGPPSAALPGLSQRPGDYRPEATPRLSEQRAQRRTALDVARDRDYLERIDSDEARTFARENPDAGREDYFRWQARGADYRSPAEARRARP